MNRLKKFLAVVQSAQWRAGRVPPVWNAEYRTALSDSLVRVGWGGAIELTDAGREALAAHTEWRPRS